MYTHIVRLPNHRSAFLPTRHELLSDRKLYCSRKEISVLNIAKSLVRHTFFFIPLCILEKINGSLGICVTNQPDTSQLATETIVRERKLAFERWSETS